MLSFSSSNIVVLSVCLLSQIKGNRANSLLFAGQRAYEYYFDCSSVCKQEVKRFFCSSWTQFHQQQGWLSRIQTLSVLGTSLKSILFLVSSFV